MGGKSWGRGGGTQKNSSRRLLVAIDSSAFARLIPRAEVQKGASFTA